MGYTRVPVFSNDDPSAITDLLFVKVRGTIHNTWKDLALLDPEDNFTVKTVCGYHKHLVKFVEARTPLRDVLEDFKKA